MPRCSSLARSFESSEKVRDLQKQMDPQFQAIHQETRARIRQILNPDQAEEI